MKITATCHCGAIKLTGDAPNGYEDAARYNCSLRSHSISIKTQSKVY